MPPRNLISSTLFVILSFAGLALAQQAALTTNLSGKPLFQSVILIPGQRQRMDFEIRHLGSVSGRVFGEVELASPPGDDPHPIRGVKVTLRSSDEGFSHFLIEQFTDEDGIYRFDGLWRGRYFVEIDPADVPAPFRITEANEIPDIPVAADQPSMPAKAVGPAGSTIERSISGITFIDNDGDGIYKSGKDTPVKGALITVGIKLAISDASGFYTIRGLPAGRTGLLVVWPKRSETTHVIFDTGSGPMADRTVDIPLSRR